MVPSRCVKSEYMKRFKQPKWEAYGPCYQELQRYRLSRRLLEQAHRPWIWDDWEQDSNMSGGGGSPSPPKTNSCPPSQPGEDVALEPVPDRIGEAAKTPGRASPAEPLRQSEEGGGQEKAEEKAKSKKAEGKSAVKAAASPTRCKQDQHSRRQALAGRSDRKQVKTSQSTDEVKGMKHPFALYGGGEKQTDTGNQKTHNVCASASETEIHESALRAKNRRQIEKRKMSQRRIHSAEVDRPWRPKPAGPDNPWMTEYMRCYSARAR